VRQVMLPIVGWDECRGLSFYQQYVTPRMICAGPLTGGKSICFGDSGGPLVCKQGDSWFQYGITSWIFTCTEPNHVSVFASVFAFRSWIYEKNWKYMYVFLSQLNIYNATPPFSNKIKSTLSIGLSLGTYTLNAKSTAFTIFLLFCAFRPIVFFAATWRDVLYIHRVSKTSGRLYFLYVTFLNVIIYVNQF